MLGLARDGAGTLVVPVAGEADASSLEEVAGVDLLAEVPSVQRWLEEQPGTLVIGNYVYADGATNARVSVAVDELTMRLQGSRDDVALGFLATPTDVFAVPAEAVEHSTRGVRRPLGRRQDNRPAAASASVDSCCAATTSPAPTPVSTTRWCRSRDRTTRSPSGCSAGVRPSPVSRARPSR